MKNKLAKLLALLLAAALLTACMAGCTGKTEQPAKAEATEKAEPAKDSTPADEEITLTFWHTYGDAEEAQFKDVVLPLWEKAHPNIKIDAVRQDGGQFHEMIVTSFGTGMSPDVARVDIANIAAYAKQGGLGCPERLRRTSRRSPAIIWTRPCPPTSIRASITACRWTPTARPQSSTRTC